MTSTVDAQTRSGLPRGFGTLPGRMPYLAVGSGPPVLYVPGLGVSNAPPRGLLRMFEASQIIPFAGHHRVWWVTRRPGMPPDTSIADMAADYATALRSRFTLPIDVIGVSTGGSVALQLAIDHPTLVRKLVIACSAYRLGAQGRAAQRQVAAEVRAGRRRAASATMMSMTGATPVTRSLLGATGWMLGETMFAHATDDLDTTIRAEDTFDVRDRLRDIQAPTLVVGGTHDAFYSPELFRETAELIPRGRLSIYPRRGHLGTLSDPRFAPEVVAFLDAPE